MKIVGFMSIIYIYKLNSKMHLIDEKSILIRSIHI